MPLYKARVKCPDESQKVAYVNAKRLKEARTRLRRSYSRKKCTISRVKRV